MQSSQGIIRIQPLRCAARNDVQCQEAVHAVTDLTLTRVRPAILLTLATAVILLASWFTVSPVSASATTASPSASGVIALQEGEEPADERPSYLAAPEDDGTEEQVYITLAVISLIGLTLIGLAFGMYGYLQD